MLRPVERLAVDRRRRRRQVAGVDGRAGAVRRRRRSSSPGRCCSALASWIAPSTFSRPAPCCSRFASGSGCAVYCRIALIKRRRQARGRLQHQRHGAGDRRRGDRRSAQHHLRFAVDRRDAERGDERAVVRRGEEVPGGLAFTAVVAAAATSLLPGATRSGLSRLSTRRTPSASTIAAARRPARAEQVDAVVAARERALEVDGADGDHRRVDARRADRAVGLLAERVLAVVAGGDDDRDARGRRAAHGDASGSVSQRLGRIRRQADVQHA